MNKTENTNTMLSQEKDKVIMKSGRKADSKSKNDRYKRKRIQLFSDSEDDSSSLGKF